MQRKKRRLFKHYFSFNISAKLVYVPAETVHALINQEEEVAVVVSYGTVQHDDDDPDTYYQKACKDMDIEL